MGVFFVLHAPVGQVMVPGMNQHHYRFDDILFDMIEGTSSIPRLLESFEAKI